MDDDSYADDVLLEAADKMGKAVGHTQGEFAWVRTGRAGPALVEKLKVDYYGREVPLQQLAGFTVPEARLLVVQPYDKSAMKAIEKAIQDSDLGINPGNDGHVMRLDFPTLTEERRRELVKVVKTRPRKVGWPSATCAGEPATTSRRWSGTGEISADELERAEKELEKVTHEHVDEIDRMLARKEQELLEV